MRIRIRSDPLIFGPPDPDPVLFSMDPDLDPTCNNRFIKLFLSWTKYKPELTNSSIKWWLISNFMPTYLKHKYIFFFISISGRIRNIFLAEPDPYMEKNVGSSLLLFRQNLLMLGKKYIMIFGWNTWKTLIYSVFALSLSFFHFFSPTKNVETLLKLLIVFRSPKVF